MVDILINKNQEESRENKPGLNLPDSVAAVMKAYTLTLPEEASRQRLGFAEPQDITDIHRAVVNSLVTSSLCTASDKRSWTFQLFKIYQQYPDSLLRKVMATLRENKMVSLKKQYNTTKVKQGNYLPLSSSPYQLSVTFSHTFLNRYQYDIYSQSWLMLKKLLAAGPGHFSDIVIGQEGGFAATVVTMMAGERLRFRTEVPEQLVVLDPNLSAVDENYVRILQRYKELLRNSGGGGGGSDIATDSEGRSPARLTSTVLFKKRKKRASQEDSDVASNLSGTAVESAAAAQRLEEVDKSGETTHDAEAAAKLKEKRVVGGQNKIVWQESLDTRSNTTLAKSASRIALYMMREEMRESPTAAAAGEAGSAEAVESIQHSHDFFVISSCDVKGKLVPARKKQYSDSEQSDKNPPGGGGADNERTVKFTGGLVGPVSELPARVDRIESLLGRYGLTMAGLQSSVTASRERKTYVPLHLDPAATLESLAASGAVDAPTIKVMRHLCQLIEESKELGLSKADLRRLACSRTADGLSRPKVVEALELAIQHCLVLAVGTLQIRFVVHKHSRDWLIHSYKLNRVRDHEKMEKLKHSGKLYVGNGPVKGETAGDGGASQVDGTQVPQEAGEAGGEAPPPQGRPKRQKRRTSLEEAMGGEDIKV